MQVRIESSLRREILCGERHIACVFSYVHFIYVRKGIKLSTSTSLARLTTQRSELRDAKEAGASEKFQKDTVEKEPNNCTPVPLKLLLETAGWRLKNCADFNSCKCTGQTNWSSSWIRGRGLGKLLGFQLSPWQRHSLRGGHGSEQELCRRVKC